jgi:hypothetical protein
MKFLKAATVTTLLVGMLQASTAIQFVDGVVFDTQGSIRPAVSLVFQNLGTREEFGVQTNGEGHFEVQLPAGEYSVFSWERNGRVFLAHLSVSEETRLRDIEIHPLPADDPSLTAIADFQVGWGPDADQRLADLINPFPERKRGRVHGSLYEFHRNDKLDARNFFDPPGEPLPRYRRNQFGGTVGAAVATGLNLQGSYDGLRIGEGSTLLAHLPTPAMKSGDFSALDFDIVDPVTGEPFPGNRIPESRISPVARRILHVVPDPNRDDPDRNFVNNDPRVQNQNHFSVRSDYELRRNSSLVGEYYYTGVERRVIHRLPVFNSGREERHQHVSLAHSRAVTDRFLVYVRAAASRNRSYSLADNSGRSGLLESLGIEGLTVDDPVEEGYPDFDFNGYTNFGDRNSPGTLVRNRGSLETSFTFVHKNHTLRGGMNVSATQLNNYRSDGLHRGRFVFSGLYSGDAFADFLLGVPDAAYRGIGPDRADLRRRQWDFFVRDQWKVLPNFEISYGVNYQLTPPYHSIHDNVSTFFPLSIEPPMDGEIVVAGSPRAGELGFDKAVDGTLIFPDRNDWSPRLGVAFSPFGSNRTVVRASYSVWHGSLDEWYFVESLSRNYPFYYIESVESSPERPAIPLEDPFGAAAVPELTVRGIDPHVRNPNTQSWRLGVENDLTRNWNVEIAYEGRKGTNMTRMIPGNVPTPGEGSVQPRRPNPEFGRFEIVNSGGSYSGHTLDLAAERRLSDGMSLRSGFAWNRFLDDGFWGGEPQNPRELAAERATAGWVPRKRFFLNYIVDLPLSSFPLFEGASGWMARALDGWRVSGITEIEDGRPFTVTVPGDPNNDGVYGDRPDRVGSGTLDSRNRSVDRWFDTSAFVYPSPDGFGTAGRNVLLGPGHQTWDISVIKRTRFSDGDTLEFRVEFFNAFNHVNFNRPNAQFGSSVFGMIFGADRAREIEVAVKYSF